MTIIEMLWECRSCGFLDNRGRFKECERCGAPRTPDSPERMPTDIESAPAVEDPELLRKFEGGADWGCRYCGASTFRADGSCASCGSPQGDSVGEAARPEPTAVDEPAPVRRRGPLAVGVLGVLLVATALWALFHERTYTVTVDRVHWAAVVHVDRYAIRAHESFAEAIPGGAFGQTPLGQRHHHDEQILDHYESVPYTVSELAGYRSESYTASEACGQSCTSIPRSCTSNRNGSATCTGGGERCSTRYCSVTRTRSVPYYHPVVHTRQEPRYRYEPRYAEWYGWRAWEWALDHDVPREGQAVTVTWPTAADVSLRLGDGERERTRRDLRLQVHFVGDGEAFEYEPKTEAEFTGFSVRSTHRIRKSAVGAVSAVDERR